MEQKEKQEEVVDMDEVVNKELEDSPVDPPTDIGKFTDGETKSEDAQQVMKEERESDK